MAGCGNWVHTISEALVVAVLCTFELVFPLAEGVAHEFIFGIHGLKYGRASLSGWCCRRLQCFARVGLAGFGRLYGLRGGVGLSFSRLSSRGEGWDRPAVSRKRPAYQEEESMAMTGEADRVGCT